MPFPPRNYFQEEFPLVHSSVDWAFSLSMSDVAQDSTIIPLFRSSERAWAIENVEVNPSHASFAEEVGITCAPKSIVPRITISMKASIAKAQIIAGMRDAVFNWMPIYTSYVDSLEAVDTSGGQTGVEVEDILELSHQATDKVVTPLYTGTKIVSPSSNLPLNTITDPDESFSDWGLTTNASLESVAFDSELYFSALKYYSNRGMLRKSSPNWHTERIRENKPFEMFSNNFTFPLVKRMNPYTFCGILIHVPQLDGGHQYGRDSEYTNPYINFAMSSRFDEWNPNFDQTGVA